MQKAIWFSRHQPTAEQVTSAAYMGYAIVVDPHVTAMAGRSLETNEDLAEVMATLAAHCRWDVVDSAQAVFGVFSTPVQGALYNNTVEYYGEGNYIGCPCFASWNITRTPEGGKPIFTHYKWVEVGRV